MILSLWKCGLNSRVNSDSAHNFFVVLYSSCFIAQKYFGNFELKHIKSKTC